METPPCLILRAPPAQNETATTLIEHLRGAGPELLTIDVKIKPDAHDACAVLLLIW